jgi:hypothetical protein
MINAVIEVNMEMTDVLNRAPSYYIKLSLAGDHPALIECRQMWEDNESLFNEAPGSTVNHQAWTGGYAEHVMQVLLIAQDLYAVFESYKSLPFTLTDALIVLFLHDIEKPFMWNFGWKKTKKERMKFRLAKIAEHNINLSLEQMNALQYVEGEGDDYRSDLRVMNELAAFCHMCDVASARIWHSVKL